MNKRLPKKSGIYRITNIENNKLYIGCATDMAQRMSDHIKTLKKNIHHNIHLQRSFNKYGRNSFVFNVLELVEDINNLVEREQFYIDSYEWDNLYNINPTATSGIGREVSEETRKKHSIAARGKNNGMYGKTHTKEARESISKKNSKPVKQIDKDTGKVIAVFRSIREASRKTNTHYACLSDVCRKAIIHDRGKTYIRKTAGGYKWEYA